MNFAAVLDGSVQHSAATGGGLQDRLIADVQRLVRAVVSAARATGQQIEQARHTAAGELGITPRRVRAYLADDVTSLSAAEHWTVRQRWNAWTEREALRLEAQAAELRAMLDAGGR